MMELIKKGFLEYQFDRVECKPWCGRTPFGFCMDFEPSIRHTFWNVVVGGGLFWTAVYGINPGQGALIGHLTSLVITLWIGLGTYLNKVAVTSPSALITERCRMLNATTTTISPIPLLSTETFFNRCPTKPGDINQGLICPIFDELFPFLPKKIRKKLHFGVRHEDFVNFSPVNPDTKDRGEYDKKDYSIKKEKPISTVCNGSPSYTIGTDYEKDYNTHL
ncbi:SLC5A8_12 [Mytilus coruscus]|uniref:SLC5A8_12 n=1 Tax=Mytilus coruscus TaxID=42192 RepID=A0A6J8CGM9_MYTCO|nr:SLC5A8_12 [Mytilus coruscus]